MDSSAILRGEQVPCEMEVYKTGDMFEQQIAEPVSWSKTVIFIGHIKCAVINRGSTYEQVLTY